MADNNCSSIIESLLKGVDSVISSKTVVGEPTTIGDTIILPLVDVSFGAGSGASLTTGNQDKKNGIGCGAITGKISPNAVLIIRNGQTKLVNIKNQDTTSKLLDMIPDVFDKVTELIDRKNMPSNEEAIDAAFPDKE